MTFIITQKLIMKIKVQNGLFNKSPATKSNLKK